MKSLLKTIVVEHHITTTPSTMMSRLLTTHSRLFVVYGLATTVVGLALYTAEWLGIGSSVAKMLGIVEDPHLFRNTGAFLLVVALINYYALFHESVQMFAAVVNLLVTLHYTVETFVYHALDKLPMMIILFVLVTHLAELLVYYVRGGHKSKKS